jgi:hypothetical protein
MLPSILYPKKVFMLVQIDSDKTVMVTFKHDDKFQENAECGFQVIMTFLFTFPWLCAYLKSPRCGNHLVVENAVRNA